jgi:hypothetical protein
MGIWFFVFLQINSVPTKPIEGQKTGTSGLRKKVIFCFFWMFGCRESLGKWIKILVLCVSMNKNQVFGGSWYFVFFFFYDNDGNRWFILVSNLCSYRLRFSLRKTTLQIGFRFDCFLFMFCGLEFCVMLWFRGHLIRFFW